MNRATATLVITFAFPAALRVRAQEPAADFFLLEEGDLWVYDVADDGVPYPDLDWWEVEVRDRKGDVLTVRYERFWVPFGEVKTLEGPFIVTLEDRGSNVDILLPTEGFVPYYRFDGDDFIHRDFRKCLDPGMVSVTADVSVNVPFGNFTGCLEFFYQDGCADYGRVIDYWCPDAGLVKFIEDNQGGVEYVLTRLERRPPKEFLRGDATAEGEVNMTDGIAVLNFLFLGAAEPTCLDAGDTDDSGFLEITDAIRIFQFLFLGGTVIDPPGPEECGTDPTKDDLSCGAFEPCL